MAEDCNVGGPGTGGSAEVWCEADDEDIMDDEDEEEEEEEGKKMDDSPAEMPPPNPAASEFEGAGAGGEGGQASYGTVGEVGPPIKVRRTRGRPKGSGKNKNGAKGKGGVNLSVDMTITNSPPVGTFQSHLRPEGVAASLEPPAAQGNKDQQPTLDKPCQSSTVSH